MSTFEITVANERINALGNNKLKVNLRAVLTAQGQIDKSKWNVVTRLSNMVNGEFFVDDFVTLQKFADFLGMSVGQLSKLVRVASYHDMEVFDGVSVGNAMEFLPLKEPGQLEAAIEMLITECGTLANATQKQIRAIVKICKANGEMPKEVEETAEEVEEVEETAEEVEEVEETAEEVKEDAEEVDELYTKADVARYIEAVLKDLGHSRDVITKELIKLEKGEL